jgi:hypothetical protein
MKKIFGLVTIAFTSLAGFAQWQGGPQSRGSYNQPSSLIINTASNRPITVVIDNSQTYQGNSNGYGNTVNIGSVYAGSHSIVVYEWRSNIFGKQRKEVVYNGNVYLKPGYETTVTVNGFGQANVAERQLYNYNNGNGQYGNNGNGAGGGYGRKKHKHQRKCGNDNGYNQRNQNGRGQQNDDWDD